MIRGARCQLYVNGSLAMTGIVDRVVDADDKRGSHLSVEGRDLMGLLVDSYAESWPDMENTPLKELAEQLLADVPFINRKAIRYQGGLAGTTAQTPQDGATGALSALGIGQKNTHVEPGQTVFDVLKRAAMSRGATFFALPDGTFVFGRPKAAGRAPFSVVHRTDGVGNNAFRSTRVRDISRRYSKITVVGQQQGYDAIGLDEINVQATATDDSMPFYKPHVAVLNDDEHSPAEYARMLLEMQRAQGFQLVYSVRGHAQNGRNWTVNELCRGARSKARHRRHLPDREPGFRVVQAGRPLYRAAPDLSGVGRMRRMIRGIIDSVVEGAIKRLASSGLAGETFANREYFQHYGFTSRPLAGAECILMREGNHIVAVASDDRRYRIAIDDGEVAIYDNQGQKAHFKSGDEMHVVCTGKLTADAAEEIEANAPQVTVNAGQSCDVTSPQVTVTASTQVSFVSPIVLISGELRVVGTVTDLFGAGGQSMSSMRETYNEHTHDENNDTVTDPPNESM